ncbi:hypothetical protein [Mycolicibacterium septicum]|uniref:hypothetical protein n=1 Tax=Mycolicibacterium septicum TaxID=98668 RepID=UPI001AF0E868|nr:hypothetical protein [Mycolicibacterium septicum]QRY51805.1 hypothetical protein JVX95_31275 [Mycolicibacterium septicum]
MKIQINYKSGQSMVVECVEFSMFKNYNGAKSAEWTDMVPKPLLFNVGEVESVWELS